VRAEDVVDMAKIIETAVVKIAASYPEFEPQDTVAALCCVLAWSAQRAGTSAAVLRTMVTMVTVLKEES